MSSYRPDIRRQTVAAAAAELTHHGSYIALVSEAVVIDASENDGWSPPVQLRFIPDAAHPGMLEIEARTVPT